MSSKEDYLKLIRLTWIMESFTNFYFLRMIVVYLLGRGVEPWIAVSIPIVFDFASLLSRTSGKITEFAIKVDYKEFHVFYQIFFLSISVMIAASRSIFLIYPLTIIIGFLSGIRNTTVTSLATANKKYESFCLIEQERSMMIGGIAGLIVGQAIYDFNPKIYIWGYYALISLSIFLSTFMKNVDGKSTMKSIDDSAELSKKEKRKVVTAVTFYGIFASIWCMVESAFQEFTPLITNKVGYLNAAYMMVEVIMLMLISGKMLNNIKKKRRLLLSNVICSLSEAGALIFATIFQRFEILMIAFLISGITYSLGDPIWGSIISEYSLQDRRKYVLVNKTYFIVRTIIQVITWFVCRQCVIAGVGSFKILAIVIFTLISIFYIICEMVTRKMYKHSV